MGDSRGISPMIMTGNVAENWKLWRSRFENYLVASEINKKDESIQCAQVLHYIGEEGFRIYTTFTFEEDKKNKLKPLLGKFESHFLPKENITFERYTFFSYRQLAGQTTEQFVTELRKMAMKCKLGNLQEELTKTMLICGLTNQQIKEMLLQEEDSLSLDKAVERCIILEMSKERSENMTKPKTVDAINQKFKPKNQNYKSGIMKKINGCSRCGTSHVINKCPAYGKKCNYCHVPNHFESKCLKKKNMKVHEVTEDINVLTVEGLAPKIIEKTEIKLKSYTGDPLAVSVLEIARKNNVRLNLAKCKFGETEIKYMGHIISKDGIKPDPSKITAISDLPKPKNKQDIQRLLGMLTYVSKFIKKFSDKTKPLRNLIKNDVEFIWENEHEIAFNNLKDILMSQPVLRFFNPNKKIVISVDASKSGVGACLLQDGLPCAYASKALSDTQTRYAQIEKELYAICFGLDKFYQYVYGQKVTVETDHQPLISIFKKSLNKCPARLQRMLLQLQKYDIELRYKPGKDLILADALSRAYLTESNSSHLDDDIESQVCMIKLELNATEEKIKEFQVQTENDPILKNLKQVILNGWPNSSKRLKDNIKIFAPYKSELTISDGLIFKGTCLVVPKVLQQEMLNRIHYSHLGVHKCVKLAQESLFWPGMIQQIKNKISLCHQCLTFANSQTKEPLKSHQIPLLPWNKISCDIYEIKGQKFLLIVDYYSKYIECVDLKNNTTSSNIIKTLKSVFSRHGIPLVLVSDGGSQLTSKEFDVFCKEWEFQHIVTSPTNAQSNGMAERHVQTAKKMFKKIFAEGKDIDMALLHYRATPVFDNISPAELLMSRKLRTNLLITKNMSKPKVASAYNKNVIKENQLQQQKYYNRGKRFLPELVSNEQVYVQTEPKGDWFPGKVLDKVRDRTYKLQMNNGSVLLRNRKYIKKLNGKLERSNHYSVATNRNDDSDLNCGDSSTKYFIELDPVEPSDSDTPRQSINLSNNNYSFTSGSPESNTSTSNRQSNNMSNSDYSREYNMSESDSDLEREILRKVNVTSSGRISKPPPNLNDYK